MKKVLSAIGNFFVNIWKWIKETAWIQPVLIVGLVFGLIASIRPISNWIKEITTVNSESNFYKRNMVSYDQLVTKVEDNNKNDVLIVIFIKDKNESCSQCESQQKQFDSFFSANHTTAEDGRNYKIAVLDIAADEFTEDKVEDEDLKDIRTLIEDWKLAETWELMPTEYNAPSGGDIEEKIDIYSENSPLPTPTIARFDGNECVGVAMGIDNNNSKFTRFCYSKNTINDNDSFNGFPGDGK